MNLEKGLDSFQIKMIALFFMVLDHIHYTFSGVFDIPMWFNILGRIAAPLFIFISVVAITHTRSPKKYLLRLWLGFLFMNIGNDIINRFFPLPSGGIIINNIFSTFFIICFIIYCLEEILLCKKENKSYIKYLLLITLPFLSGFIMIFLMGNIQNSVIMLTIFKIFMYFVPTFITCEGGFVLILLGILYYIFRNNKKHLCISYFIFCIFVLLLGYNKESPIESMFLWNIQYFMVLALPFLALYNGEKGKNIKYFFYGFYPAHIYILTILSYVIYNIKLK